jgi:mono/diheme cytochrome c family protein
MWTGKMSEEEMLHEHPLELADIKAGIASRQFKPEVLRKRQMIYYPIAGVLTVIMLAGVYGFVNSEETALTTVPPLPTQIPVYVPQTPTPVPTKPPTPTPLPATATPEGQAAEPAAGLSWADVAPLMEAKCAACHSNVDMTGLALDTYANTMAGGKNGEIVIPGDSANSILYTSQAAGGHPGIFTDEELAIIQAWIDAGALEVAGTPSTAGPTWDDVAPVVQEKCGACHTTTDLTGLALDTYANTLAGGANGPIVVPGDSANSILYSLQAAGGHPGMFSEDELALIQEWIDAGALESVKSGELASGPVWEGELSALLQEKCSSCHGPAAMGGLNLSTYADMLNGGTSGPVVVPGDGANSLFMTLQQAGGHPGQLTPEEISLVQAWIDAGALEK